MSIWVLHQSLSPDEESHIEQREHLVLPFDGLPDLSAVASQLQCRHLMQLLYPDDPPEAITRRVDRLWPRYSGLQKEDIIAVPLASRKAVALAEVGGKYLYRVGVSGEAMHLIPVTWHKAVSLRSLYKHKDLFERTGEPMMEVTRAEARIAIRDHLPHSYNRFAKWKWLLVVFFLMGLVRFFVRVAGQP